MEKQFARTVGYSLYPNHEKLIEDAMKALRRKTPSDTLQYIIMDWAQLRAELFNLEHAKGNENG